MSGNIRPQSSQLGEPLWTDPGIKSGISVLELISIQKKRKKKKTAGGELMVEHSPKILASEEKVTTPQLNVYLHALFYTYMHDSR